MFELGGDTAEVAVVGGSEGKEAVAEGGFNFKGFSQHHSRGHFFLSRE